MNSLELEKNLIEVNRILTAAEDAFPGASSDLEREELRLKIEVLREDKSGLEVALETARVIEKHEAEKLEQIKAKVRSGNTITQDERDALYAGLSL